MKPSLPVTILSLGLFLAPNLPAWTADAATDGKLAAKWILADFSDGEVKNQVADGGPLVLQNSEPPAAAEEMGVKGLRFGNRETLYGKSNELPGIGGAFGEPDQPFAIRMIIVPLEKHLGAYGGLFETRGTDAGLFRFVLNQQMKLMVEFPGSEGQQGVSGTTPLGFGTAYTVELRYDGTKFTILLDGQVEAEKEFTFSTPFTGDFRIGQASGQNYDFNGVISEVSILSLQP